MKQVPADAYVAAVDSESFDELAPIAQSEGWECFAGPRDDVLERFCLAAEEYKLETIVRATADNPFLFYEAAQESLEAFNNTKPDYLTFTSLPHGSGVEIFNTRALFKARNCADSPYEREHVGPALYNHADSYKCSFILPRAEYRRPEWNTSVDTTSDYRRALRLARVMKRLFPHKKNRLDEPFSLDEICRAYDDNAFKFPVLLVPSVKKGRGTGHLRRMLELARGIDAEVFIQNGGEQNPRQTLDEVNELLQEAFEAGLERDSVIFENASGAAEALGAFPCKREYALIISDLFAMTESEARRFSSAAPLAAIDEGSRFSSFCDYLLDIIPPLQNGRKINYFQSGFITLPANTRENMASHNEKNASARQKILVTFGGEDPADLTLKTTFALYKALRVKENALICAVTKDPVDAKKQLGALDDSIPVEERRVEFIPRVKDLREKLFEYDAVVTHYGLTAYEALYAGCFPLLVATTPLHAALAKKYGFACLSQKKINAKKFASIFSSTPPQTVPAKLTSQKNQSANEDFFAFIKTLAKGKRFACPVCGAKDGAIEARAKEKTYKRCASCGITYISFLSGGEAVEYSENYFFEEYKKQYGKTYLEDFFVIKSRGDERIKRIASLLRKNARGAFNKGAKNSAPLILDAGCAYGPFLSAASDAKWQAYGLDVSQSAVDYVTHTLGFPVCRSSLEDFNPVEQFGVHAFDAVTLWFVLEHFETAGDALKKIHSLLKPGGILAFSTPSLAGISRKAASQEFFEASPRDHFALWHPDAARTVMRKFGFEPLKIVSTGHHPERFLLVKKYPSNALLFNAAWLWSRARGLGDTFEMYCVKTT
jgi:spore coat polysaccharide biosynthesis protein SpsF (cytidylyltransferase family)/2-polyprenyl-3-methyl-5-hydroxy-6-metoxy-1,4-benzoquinol methylase/spore coat polysaccharide biosynthesis predicted glycosyltransferase SpsG/predicted RNA-binding Zn-ribbon protein involved in translation (DUF1610 family)